MSIENPSDGKKKTPAPKAIAARAAPAKAAAKVLRSPRGGRSRAPQGVSVQRRFSTPGRDPLDEVTYDRRDSVITNPDGSVVFACRGAEIPAPWSQLATDIVVSKYFRKSGIDGDASKGELSVRQLVHRIASSIRAWGEAQGYFTDKASAETFEAELSWLLVNQYGAFNSPVWFNCGLFQKYGILGQGGSWAWDEAAGVVKETTSAYERPQCSACFIQAVQDDLMSIFDLVKNEARLFKYGSGCTADASRIYVEGEGFLPIGDLYRRLAAEGRPVQDFDGKGRYIDVTDLGLRTLSVDPRTGAYATDRIDRVWSYDVASDAKLTVRFDNGARATVSAWHPFLVWDGERVVERRADQLTRGDTVLGPNETAVKSLATRPVEIAYDTRYFGHEEPRRVALNPDLAWLVGYFLGDGSLGESRNRVTGKSGRTYTYEGLRLRFHDETVEVLERVAAIIEREFAESATIQQDGRGSKGHTLTYTGRRATGFFAALFEPGPKTYTLAMPDFVWEGGRDLALAFLAGLVDSDGYVSEGRAKYSTASRDFARDVGVLAALYGLGGGTVQDDTVHTVTVLHRHVEGEAREALAARMSHPTRRQRLLEYAPDGHERKFCMPLSRGLALELFGDRPPAAWLKTPVGDDTVHLGRLQYEGLINPTKLLRCLEALGRRDALGETLGRVARGALFVASVEPCRDDPAFFDLTVASRNNYLAGEAGLVAIHNTGSNFSALRGRQEKLSGGGTSSGLMSFLEVFDRAAGSTKSGGTTRRAAKMVCLDMDHPEIVDFIEWKMREERKAQALIAQGYPADFNGPAYHTVSGQNSNNSVRVTDDFMRAVEADGPWQTRMRTTGAVVDTLRARDLWRKLAESAWACADPGVQYDSTINDWHTVPNSGRINASNPCVTGDALVATARGMVRIDAMLVSDAEVVGADGELHPIGPAFPTGVKPVYRLRTAAGFELDLTADHRVLTVNRGDVPAGELTRDDRVVLGRPPFGPEALDPRLAEFVGLVLGDGCLMGAQETALVTLSPDEDSVARRVAQGLNAFKREHAVDARAAHDVEVTRPQGTLRFGTSARCVVDPLKRLAVAGEGSARKAFTDEVYALDRASVAALLRGLFTADGTVANYGEKSQYVALDSASLALLQQVQRLLLGFGIKARIYRDRRVLGQTTALLPDGHGGRREYPVQQVHSLRVARDGRLTFEREVGFLEGSVKRERLRQLNAEVAPYRDRMDDRVEALTFLGERPVFDLTEPATHHFVANGLVVHNCSEYMHLDDSACNLSSLNLTKFLREKADGGLEFDVEAYRHAARVFFIAQELLVDFSSYPTQGIAKNSHDYRPLGLGYANLGTLLMLQGIAYDSDAGRAVAGALTAIMTGHAYRVSAEMAAVKGPFPGFAKNREPMLRVMKKHQAAAYQIDARYCPPELLKAAQEDWDEAVRLGEEHGYRNGQATVLAPTGCLVGGSLIPTERGLVRLRSLGDPDGARWQELGLQVATDQGPRTATQFYVNGREHVVTVETARGYRIRGTPTHRIKVVEPATGEWTWKRFAEVEEDDLVPLAMNQLVGAPQHVPLPPLPEAYWTEERALHVPRAMTPDLAELLGYFMGDGSLHAKGLRFCVSREDQDVAARLTALGRSLFGIEACATEKGGYTEVALHSVRLTLWWEACGFVKRSPRDGHTGKGYLPHIPDAVLHANDRAVYAAFVRGLFEADGTVMSAGYPSWSTTSLELSHDVQALLLALGYPTTRKMDITGWGQSALAVLRLVNLSYNARWLAEVGFLGARKRALVRAGDAQQAARKDHVPVPRALIDRLTLKDERLRPALLLELSRHGAVSRRIARELFVATQDAELGRLLDFYYDRVAFAELGDEQLTYDLSVPDNVTYVANGFVSHNTIGLLMDCDTTGIEPDFALVKYKKLAGGGFFKIVNASVERALRRLGYSAEETRAIMAHVHEHETVEGAPGLRDEHLQVFDCANRCGRTGRRFLAPMAHLRMMAAAQPFLSGAISKTVNLPNESTVDDVQDIYLQGWKLGLKAVALYRDGCKASQPLNTSADKEKDKKPEPKPDAPATVVAPVLAPAAPAVPAVPAVSAVAAATGSDAAEFGPLFARNPVLSPARLTVRHRLPSRRRGFTQEARIGGHKVFLRTGEYEDGELGEIFIDMHKEGAAYRSLMNSFAIAVSLGLQHGVPLNEFVEQFTFTRFEPQGAVQGHPNVKFATSIIDYVFRVLSIEYLKRYDLAHIPPEETRKEPQSAPVSHSQEGYAPQAALGATTIEDGSENALSRHLGGMMGDAPICDKCGHITVRNGACYRCLNCGNSMGCS
ncbi:MAG: hypothetical protein HY909_12785 [Deltaproteobacteria bacterium]|nr:hypothetical protein [Deltaproteobacteria bacterium]